MDHFFKFRLDRGRRPLIWMWTGPGQAVAWEGRRDWVAALGSGARWDRNPREGMGRE